MLLLIGNLRRYYQQKIHLRILNLRQPESHGMVIQTKPIVTISSTEEEYVSLSYMIKEILFIKGILEFMKIKLQLPIKVHVDNKGEIFISQNPTVKRTKKINTRYHLILQYLKMGSLKLSFYKPTRTSQTL